MVYKNYLKKNFPAAEKVILISSKLSKVNQSIFINAHPPSRFNYFSFCDENI